MAIATAGIFKIGFSPACAIFLAMAKIAGLLQSQIRDGV